ncbi:MAG: PilN domain-containing protein [Gammaproteobacteria bacterium]|jgi:type IV pilus assembly protein PilN
MAKINLLPWREELRKEKQQEFFAMLGVVALAAVCVWGLVHFYYSQRIEAQELRNTYMHDQIALLDKKIEQIKKLEKDKQRLLDRMHAIERLQSNRPLIVRFFDELIDSLPDGVSVTQINQKGHNITIHGEAQSNARVSSFMRNLNASKWLKSPKLDIIQGINAKGNRIAKFTLRFQQVVPKTGEKTKS